MNTSLNYFLYRFAWSSLDLIFPPVCGGCGNRVRGGARIASAKFNILLNRFVMFVEFQWTSRGFVQTVSGRGLDIASSAPGQCLMLPFAMRCINLNIAAIWRWEMRSPRNYRSLLLSLKWPVEMIVPVPLGKKRSQERGYNQVSLIARPLALAAGMRLRS